MVNSSFGRKRTHLDIGALKNCVLQSSYVDFVEQNCVYPETALLHTIDHGSGPGVRGVHNRQVYANVSTTVRGYT